MIPNEYFSSSNVFEPMFRLNEDQMHLNKIIHSHPISRLVFLKKRNIGMSTFFALFALHHARTKKRNDFPPKTVIVCLNMGMVSGMIKTLKSFYSDYCPRSNDIGIQVISQQRLTDTLRGQDLNFANVLIDEVQDSPSPTMAEMYEMLIFQHLRYLITVATVNENYATLFPDLKNRGFVEITQMER